MLPFSGQNLRRVSRILLFTVCASLALLPAARPAWALKNRTIIWRATGSGAILGLGAGLVSYPFAKSTNTIVAGVAVGTILGAVYGYYLVESREERYRQQLEEGRGYGKTESLLENYDARNAEREAVLRQAPRSRNSTGLRIPVEISVVAYRF